MDSYETTNSLHSFASRVIKVGDILHFATMAKHRVEKSKIPGLQVFRGPCIGIVFRQTARRSGETERLTRKPKACESCYDFFPHDIFPCDVFPATFSRATFSRSDIFPCDVFPQRRFPAATFYYLSRRPRRSRIGRLRPTPRMV